MSETAANAYTQSMQAARALMAAAEAEEARTRTAEELKRQHKLAARIWYDLLEELDPPVNTADWWTLCADRMNEAYNRSGQDELVRVTLLALMEYLERKATNEKN